MAFKSSEYAWSDMQIVIGGRPITGVVEVSYELERPTTKIFGAGKKAHSRTQGNEEATGEIVLLQSEFEALQEAAGPGKNITDLEFDIVVHYAKSIEGRQKTDILENCVVTKISKGMKQGDPNMPVKLPLDIGDIKYNA